MQYTFLGFCSYSVDF